MAFNGCWKRTGSDNGLALMKAAGMPDEVIDALKSVEVSMTIKQDGDNFDEVFKTGDKENRTIMTLGKEGELRQWTGEMVKCVAKADGPKKVVTQFEFKGHKYLCTRELTSDNQLVDTIDLDGGASVGKFIYTKC